MTKHILKLEEAKSWFVLAQLSIILAGFLFASSSIALTNSQKNLDSSVQAVVDVVYLMGIKLELKEELTPEVHIAYTEALNLLSDISKDFSSLSESNKNYAVASMLIASLFVIISIISFSIGRVKILKIRSR